MNLEFQRGERVFCLSDQGTIVEALISCINFHCHGIKDTITEEEIEESKARGYYTKDLVDCDTSYFIEHIDQEDKINDTNYSSHQVCLPAEALARSPEHLMKKKLHQFHNQKNKQNGE